MADSYCPMLLRSVSEHRP